jgi:hypothetical protein
VDTAGSDYTGDGSYENPLATINHALSKISAGDAIMVQPGTYPQSTIIDINDPVRHANITITGSPLDRPLIAGNPNKPYVFHIRPGVKGVTLSYLKIRHSSTGRMTTESDIVHVSAEPFTLKYCELWNGYRGILFDVGRNVEIAYNKIYTMGRLEPNYTDPDSYGNNGQCIAQVNYSGRPSATSWDEKVHIHHNECYDAAEDGVIINDVYYKYIEINNNHFHNNWEDGIDLKNAQYVKIHHNTLNDNFRNGINCGNNESSTDVEIYNNDIYNNDNWGIWAASDSTDWTVYNNLIYNNCQNPPSYGAAGIQMSGSGHQIYHNVIYNNTIPSTAKYPNAANMGYGGTATFKNNIVYNNATQRLGNIYSTSTGTIDNNYVYPTSRGLTGTNAITVSDPKLTDPANGDFTLQSDSPLIDTGVTLALVTDDFAGTARPQGSAYDIGAYEFYTAEDTTPPETTITTGIPEFTGSSEITIGYTGTDDVSSDGSLEFSYSVDIVTWSEWTTFTSVSITGLADGPHIFEVKARDEAGNEDPTPASVSFTVDTTPPAVDLNQPNPSILWPPNGEMVPVVFSGSAVDIGSGLDRLTYTMVDEYGEFGSAGAITTEPTGGFSFILSLKADRDGNDSKDRIYTVTVTAVDMAGNATEKTVTVMVPHKNEG